MPKRPFAFIAPLLAGFCTTVLLIGPFSARAETAPSPAIEIVRSGDHAMTCPALTSEINGLDQSKPVAEAKPKKHGGFGFLRALGSAMPLVGGGMGGALVSSVADTASQLATTNQVASQIQDAGIMTREAMEGGSPAQQRNARLMTIFDEKKC